jgi:outer membrane protein assembly factor BamE (lipoprotein component of BamABCDE complex)
MLMILVIHLILLVAGCSVAGFLFFRRRHLLALAVLFLLTPASIKAWAWFSGIDAVSAWIYPSDTVYAAGFRPQSFRRVIPGMSRDRLLALLGEPLEKWTYGEKEEYWHYSRHGARFGNYWNVIVVVDPRAGKVVRRSQDFYTD